MINISNNAFKADVVLLNTCAIREKAEVKIWERLNFLKSQKKKGKKMTVGVLGCMAERLKVQLLEAEKMVDVVVGPDAYRDLPRLIAEGMCMCRNSISEFLSGWQWKHCNQRITITR
jgi:tRNA-2-methylthio-N6-dimethylallyladenosine synthase